MIFIKDHRLLSLVNERQDKDGHALKKNRLLLFLGFLVIGLLSAAPVLLGLARFLAPQGAEKADAVVVEGGQIVQEGLMRAGVSLIREGRARQIVIVLHGYSPKDQLFAIQDIYPNLIGKALEDLGLKNDQYQILVAPIDRHPITLEEARYVAPRLYQAGIRNAFLLCQGFHTRRSLLVYQIQGDPLGIRFIPYPFFPYYDRDSWWKTADSLVDFVSQIIKLGYYLCKGYIPLTYLFRGNPVGSQ
jgi:uncharacterized SAM-binding protein YcdF (DUF218 family)